MGCAGYFVGDEIELQGMYCSDKNMYKRVFRGGKTDRKKIAHVLAKKIQEDISEE